MVELTLALMMLLDDLDALFRLRLEEMNSLDQALEEAFDDIRILLDERHA